MSAQVVEEQEPTVETIDTSAYEGRLLGRTKAQKEREVAVRDDERGHWVARLSRLGDGRQNRKASKEAREAYRHAAAMIAQNREG